MLGVAAPVRSSALALSCAVAVLVSPARARADELRLDPAVDAVALGMGAALGIMLEVLAQTDELSPAVPGSLSDVNPLDRWVAEGSSDGTETPHQISNVLLAVAYAAAVFEPISTGVVDGAEAGWTDFILVAEALATNAAVTNLVKLAVRRPRPISYVRWREGSLDPDDTDATLSFSSGHTSTAATVTAALTTTAFIRRPAGCPRPWIVLATGTALTIATGAMRVAAKRHFVTDVVVGAVMGTGIGVAVPLLHRHRTTVTPALAVVAGGGTAGVAGVW